MKCPIDLDRHDKGPHELDVDYSPKFPAGKKYCTVCNRYLDES